MNAKQIGYCLKYAAQAFFLGRQTPFLFALVITDTCNLDCFYCGGRNAGKINFSSNQAFTAISDAYQRGHRALYFTGGEPMLWQSGEHKLKDLVEFAFETGFFEVFIFTNGTRPLDIPGCHYIVTVDGPKEIHNKIRKDTYDLVLNNVRNAVTDAVVASMTLTKANVDYLEDYVRDLSGLGIFRSLAFNLLTRPPEDLEEYGLLGEERNRALDRIWSLRKQGYPVNLSRAAYKALRSNRWQRPIKQIELATPDRLFTCCRQGRDPRVCDNCGYFGCVEISQMLRLKPSAVWRIFRLAA
jgi:MoaA/NifB/PqqE/SkfB family radical SAM enzyme